MRDTDKPGLLIATKAFYPVIGGVEEVVASIAQACRTDFDVTVLAVGESRITTDKRREGIRAVKVARLAKVFSAPLSLEYVSRFKSLAREANIINVHSPYPLAELAQVSSRLKSSVVNTYHFDIVRQKVVAPMYHPLLNAALRGADRILVSNPNLRDTSHVLRNHIERVHVNQFGVDPKEYSPSELEVQQVRRIRSGFTRPIVLFVGRLVYYKGVEYLVRAAAQVPVDLALVGSGTLENSLRRLATALGMRDRVHFIPHLPRRDLVCYFNACDLFVLPSVARSEAFGLVLIEAMACGKPVISTDIGTGPSWINQDGITGLVVPPRDPSALSAAIARIASDPALAERMGQAALQRARDTFSQKRFGDFYVSLFKSLLR